MFERTKFRLIVMYSSLIGCILFIMVLFFYFLLSHTISTNVENELKLTSQRIQNEWKTNMPRGGKGTYVNYSFIPLNQVFVLTTEDGDVMYHSLRDEELLTTLKTTLAEHLAASAQAQFTTYTLDDNRVFEFLSIENSDHSVLFIGMEVTENVNLLIKMKWLLTLVASFFLLLSIGMGYWFSRRAMIPIQQAYQRQQDFVSDASHELRTPLSIMRASIEIIEEEQAQLPSFHQKVLADMREELSRMTRMIEGLLTLARSDSGRLEIIPEHFHLGDLLQTSSEAFEILAAQRQIRISCVRSCDGDTMFFGDKERMKQLLYILLDNAIKYSKPGGEVQVSLTEKEKVMILQISDNGIGIPQEKIPFIFERFYRVDHGRTRAQGGAGLGLSIAKWIVDAHRGQFKVTSEVDKGTTVQILLPSAGR
jgi:signal transduction histidine kinase